jgi:hypothetical protein
LKNMGNLSLHVPEPSVYLCLTPIIMLGWSDDDLWSGIRKGEQWYPTELTTSRLGMTLFECDGRSGDDALWWRSACADNGCHDGGSGHSDYCE